MVGCYIGNAYRNTPNKDRVTDFFVHRLKTRMMSLMREKYV